MSELGTSINLKSSDYLKNKKFNKNLADKLLQDTLNLKKQRKKSTIDKHQKNGKLLVHDRISLLIDKNSVFFEVLVFSICETNSVFGKVCWVLSE